MHGGTLSMSGPGGSAVPDGTPASPPSRSFTSPGSDPSWNNALCESCRCRPGLLIDSRYHPAFLLCPGCWLP